MECGILTIVISTYNRCDIFEVGLKSMLSCSDERIRFLIGDNASTDKTWKMLTEIKDNRVSIRRNTTNYGANNAVILSQYVETPFFLCLNDRDWISSNEISKLIEKVINFKECELIFMCRGSQFQREGICKKKESFRCFFYSEHPGHIIYNTEYFHSVVNYDRFIENILKGRERENAGYVEYVLLDNLKKSSFVMHDYINQPKNRDSIVQTRKEIYGSPYIMAENQANVYKSIKRFVKDNQMKEIMIARFVVSLYKTEVEYNLALQSQAFKRRYACENVKSSKWFKNGWEYTEKIILENKDSSIKKSDILIRFVFWSVINCMKICRNKVFNMKYN